MDEIYRARLSSTPHPPGNLQLPEPAMQPQPHPHTEDIHISAPGAAGTGASQPIPIQLPNIYVNPFPPPAEHHHSPDVSGTRHHNGPEINIPTMAPHRKKADNTIKIGPWRVAKPHPLLWLCLGLSVVALVLGVPKGSLPTLTGRHKALQAQEKLLTQKAELISQLSHFLPPPLSTLVAPALPSDPATSLLALNDRGQLEYIHNAGMRFWNTYNGHSVVGGGGEDRWWSVEELGEGASLVRSKTDGREKEVWVLRMGDDRDGHRTLQNALTHSLLLRDRLQTELEKEKAKEKSAPVATIEPANAPAENRSSSSNTRDTALEKQREEAMREERIRLEEARRREREREREVEEREVEVARREKWVVDEMRKLSDKVHAQATELTLEDRITERIKAYQRQLAALQTAERDAAGSEESRAHSTGKTEL